MDRWMDGWMEGWFRWMDGWMEDRWLVGQMDGQLDGWTEDGWEKKREEVEFYLGPARTPQSQMKENQKDLLPATLPVKNGQRRFSDDSKNLEEDLELQRGKESIKLSSYLSHQGVNTKT